MQADCRKRRADGFAGRCHLATHRRSAMTLFELLLVLVLLVVVGSLATPLFEGSFASIRLRSGADQVLATWSQARTHAIESGQIYQFRFQPEGSRYRVDPWTMGLEGDSLETTEATPPAGSTVAEVELSEWKLDETLPEGILFHLGEGVTQDITGQRQVQRIDQEGEDDLSAPILFFPDGTTSEAALQLKNNREIVCQLTLRALTGVARASSLLTREEVERFSTR